MIIPHHKVGFISETQLWLNMWRSIYIIHNLTN
jgi:hypothetical protein